MTDETPGPDPRVTDEEILQLFRESDDPVLSTAEVTEQLPLSRRSVYNHLQRLKESGDLDGKTVGGRATVYWIR